MKLSQLFKLTDFSGAITVVDKQNGNIAKISRKYHKGHVTYIGIFTYLNPEHIFLGVDIIHTFGDGNITWEFYKPIKTILPLP